MNGENAPRRVFERKGNPFWSHEGRQVVISVPVGGRWGKFETWRVNADGTGRVKLPIPEHDLVLDCSRDGNWLATRTISGEPRHEGRLTLAHPDGTDARYLTEGSANNDLFSIFKISPDGRKVAYVEIRSVNDLRTCTLFFVDIDGNNRCKIPLVFEPGATVGVCWSPDGSQVALNPTDGRTKLGSIAIVNVDGSNFRKLALPPGSWNIHVCDWNTLTPRLKVGGPDETIDLKTPRGRYQALQREIKKEKPFDPRKYLGRFLEIAESAPNDPAAVDALIWVINFGFNGPEFDRAIDRLAQNHAERRKVGLAASSLAHALSSSAEKLLRAVIEKGPDETIKGMACLALGRFFKHQSEHVRDIRGNPDSIKRWEAMFLEAGADKESFSRFLGRDPDALLKESEVCFERTIKEFGDKSRRGDSLIKDAQAELFEMRELCVGKPAPEVSGRDFDGKPLKLSDFKGKVVVVDFWTTTCGACQQMSAYERPLVKRLQGKPFVLVGVNCDQEQDKPRDWITKEAAIWRSWRDGDEGNASGPIFRQFNVQTWPTLYILDQRGIIRHRFKGFPGAGKLDTAINALVQAAEAG